MRAFLAAHLPFYLVEIIVHGYPPSIFSLIIFPKKHISIPYLPACFDASLLFLSVYVFALERLLCCRKRQNRDPNAYFNGLL
jgi:hypothetical protein